MSFRLRLCSIPKPERKKYEGLGIEMVAALLEVDKDGLYEPKNTERLLYIGGHENFGFNNNDVEEFYSFDLYREVEMQCQILKPSGLIRIIETFKSQTASYYADITGALGEFEETDDGRILLDRRTFSRTISAMSCKNNDWSAPSYIANMNPSDVALTESGSKEYIVFNLLHVLKTFNFDDNYLILSGW